MTHEEPVLVRARPEDGSEDVMGPVQFIGSIAVNTSVHKYKGLHVMCSDVRCVPKYLSQVLAGIITFHSPCCIENTDN